MTVDVDDEACMECGACADVCPEVFQMDERTGKALVIAFDIADGSRVEEAVSICPAECIYWKD